MCSKEIYQVLARKYRPRDFSGLIGQDKLVRILSNAILSNRVGHAFLLTGTRGTGKTTTARLISKTINCTCTRTKEFLVIPCESCINCEAHQENKHPDLIELDAASRTGVLDIRDIIETVRYSPSLGKYKFYVIDEVHMLSNNAFNALLKTLEEPPEHTKFILATTEVKKIPLTIVSRCQRFDLTRIPKEILINHIENIAQKEGFSIEKIASVLIAEAAAGSVRDSLSLLDNAFSYAWEESQGVKQVTSDIVKQMLGIISPKLIYDLFGLVINGNTNEAIDKLQEIYFLGIEIIQLFEDLSEILTLVTKFQYNKNIEVFGRFSDLKEYIALWNTKLNVEFLTTLWQILVKGLQEIKFFANALQAAEMVIIRLCNVAILPLPSELVKRLQNAHYGNKIPEEQVTSKEIKKALKLNSFDQVLELFKKNKEMIIYHSLYEDVQLVKFERNKIELKANEHVPKDLPKKIQILLERWTEEKWSVIFSEANGQKPVKEQKDDEKQKMIAAYEKDKPLVREIYEKFPGSKITDIKIKESQ